jgi:hypothetical protein
MRLRLSYDVVVVVIIHAEISLGVVNLFRFYKDFQADPSKRFDKKTSETRLEASTTTTTQKEYAGACFLDSTNAYCDDDSMASANNVSIL